LRNDPIEEATALWIHGIYPIKRNTLLNVITDVIFVFLEDILRFRYIGLALFFDELILEILKDIKVMFCRYKFFIILHLQEFHYDTINAPTLAVDFCSA
jgi:hypothetical protein